MKNKWFILPITIIIMFFIGFGIAKMTNLPTEIVIEEKIVEIEEEFENSDLEKVIINKVTNDDVKDVHATKNIATDALRVEIKNSTVGFLEMFDFAPPEMTEENINKHNNFIKSLNKDPIASLEFFKEVISESQNDGERGNLVNLVNKLNLSQKEKAGFYSSYIEELKVGEDGDVIDDNSLSALIAIDYLIENVPPEEISSYIQQTINGKSEVVKTTILDRFSAYYPDIVESFR